MWTQDWIIGIVMWLISWPVTAWLNDDLGMALFVTSYLALIYDVIKKALL